MADMGIMVEYLFASKDVKVNTPIMIKGRCQFDAESVVRDGRMASKIIHFERIIGYAKTLTIQKKTLNSEQTCMGGRIVVVCFMLTNFRPSIVG